jgi:hypothetical protein
MNQKFSSNLGTHPEIFFITSPHQFLLNSVMYFQDLNKTFESTATPNKCRFIMPSIFMTHAILQLCREFCPSLSAHVPTCQAYMWVEEGCVINLHYIIHVVCSEQKSKRAKEWSPTWSCKKPSHQSMPSPLSLEKIKVPFAVISKAPVWQQQH